MKNLRNKVISTVIAVSLIAPMAPAAEARSLWGDDEVRDGWSRVRTTHTLRDHAHIKRLTEFVNGKNINWGSKQATDLIPTVAALAVDDFDSANATKEDKKAAIIAYYMLDHDQIKEEFNYLSRLEKCTLDFQVICANKIYKNLDEKTNWKLPGALESVWNELDQRDKLSIRKVVPEANINSRSGTYSDIKRWFKFQDDREREAAAKAERERKEKKKREELAKKKAAEKKKKEEAAKKKAAEKKKKEEELKDRRESLSGKTNALSASLNGKSDAEAQKAAEQEGSSITPDSVKAIITLLGLITALIAATQQFRANALPAVLPPTPIR